MSANPLKSIGMKLFLIIFLSIVLCVSSVGLYSYNTSKDIIESKVADATHQTLIKSRENLDLILQGYVNLSTQLFLDSDLIEQLETLVSNTTLAEFERLELYKTLRAKIDTYTYSNEDIWAIHIYIPVLETAITTTGKIDSTIVEQSWYEEAFNLGGAPLWMDTLLNGYIQSKNADDVDGKFAFARQIRNPATSTDLGMMIVEIRADILGRELAKIELGEGAQLSLVNSEGQYMQSENPELIGQVAPISVGKVNTVKEGIGTLTLVDGDQLVIHDKSDIIEWTMIGSVPIDILTKDAAGIFRATLWMTLFSALLALLISYVVMRIVARPLVHLRNLMKQGEEGNLLVRMNFRSSDEIGQLAQSFNQMMEQITVLVKQTSISAQEVLERAGELSEASQKTALSAKEISVATEEIASGASTLATEAERGNDLTSHVSIQMRSVVEANMRMGTSAIDVRNVSEQGTSYMVDLIKKTYITEEKTRTMVEKVDRLKDSTASIRKIIEVLNNLSKQTNILSLNATIEAARAGAAGKGFMVVADEIRKLADQSRQSINVVAEIAETIQTEIVQTVGVLSEAYPMFQEQIVSVKEAESIFQDVQNHMSGFIDQLDSVTESIQQLEQSQFILSGTMSSVSAVSEQSSATSEEVASLCNEQLNVSQGLVLLAERLNSLSSSLKETLSRFTV